MAGLGASIETIELPDEFDVAAAIHKTMMTAGIAEAFAPLYAGAKDVLSPSRYRHRSRMVAGRRAEFIAALTARDRLRRRSLELEPDDRSIRQRPSASPPKRGKRHRQPDHGHHLDTALARRR